MTASLQGSPEAIATIVPFNTLTSDPFLAAVPAVLLLGSKQADLAGAARSDGRRRVVQMPVQTEDMTRVLHELLTGNA